MSLIRVSTSFNLEIDFEAPAFHRRLFAWAIDLTVLVFYMLIANKLLSFLQGTMGRSDDAAYNNWALGLAVLLPFFLYHPVCEISMNGRSIGKRLMNLQVVNENGGKPAISQYIIRWLIRTSDYTVLIIIVYSGYLAVYPTQFVSAIGGSLLLLLADIILVNSKKHQRLGDLLAQTIVIQINNRASIDDTIFLSVADGYTPSFPQVMRLSDRDINALKSISDTAKRNHDYDLAAHASEKIKAHLSIETSMSPFDFLEILLKDYNYLASR
jgi:uncharacterized RDD family membrane protein YckC